MKILDIPQSGKRGLNVSQASPFGQISRTLAIPSNPRFLAQMGVRAILGRVAASWRTIMEAQRAAWIAAAKEAKSNSRLGQSGALSGFQLFAKINCTLAQFGQEQVDAPPAQPQFPDLTPAGLGLTISRGVLGVEPLPTPGFHAGRRLPGRLASWIREPASLHLSRQ